MKKIYVKGKNTLRKAGYTGLISAILTFIIITGAVFFAAPVLHAENITGADYEEISVDPVENKEGYSSVIYNDVNGLPTSEANAITETEDFGSECDYGDGRGLYLDRQLQRINPL